jgi:uncharacterized protein (TIGR02391 family)
MASPLNIFERIVRRAHRFTEASPESETTVHPFESRNIHSDFPDHVRHLFDDGYYAQATLEGLKFLDEEVQHIAKSGDFGMALMMRVFGGSPPPLPLNPGMTLSEKNEQEGFKFLFAGAIQGIRNPRGHTTSIRDDPDLCLDHLSFASMLLRKLEDAGLR